MRLEGKSALITGGGGGIGSAAARLFCSEGAGVLLVDANSEALAQKSKAVATGIPGARVATFTADVADDAQAQRAFEAALKAFGHIDALVNNAAMRNYTRVAEVKQIGGAA